MNKSDALVGREGELKELTVALSDAAAGHGRFITIEGEPGIGKTRLVDEFCSHAQQQGAAVLRSRCSKYSAAPIYWPWIQIVRACLERVAGHDFYRQLKSSIDDIAEILPLACRGLAYEKERSRPSEHDPEQVRLRLTEAVRLLLRSAAALRPMVLILDELGPADAPSLLLLDFLVRDLDGSRILIVATFRTADVRNSAALADTIGGLARNGTSIVLRGLSEEEAGRMLQQRGISDPEFCAAVFRAAGGNPFLLSSVTKLWAGRLPAPGEFKLAGTMTAALEAHFAGLSAKARKMLTIAAVLGQEFDPSAVEHALCVTHEEMLDLIAQAEDLGLITHVPEFERSRYRFVHSLVRDALYEGIRPAERARLHNTLAESIEDLYAEDLDDHLSDLAFHFYAGIAAGSAHRALDYAQRAAERATELAAFEEATRWCQVALSVMRQARSFSKQRECEILLALGDTENRSANYAGARETFARAFELARRLGDGELMARAALGYPGLQWGAAANEQGIALLEASLKILPRKAEAWRAMLMARLASELYHRPAAAPRRRELINAAVEIGRRIGDKHALLAILGHRDLTLSGPDSLAERFANAEEMTHVAEDTANYLGLYMGFLSRSIYFRQVGDLVKAEAEAQAMELLANMTRLPVCKWGARCFATTRALLEGRFDEGEKLARECLDFAKRMRGAEASELFWPALVVAMVERGRLAELEPLAQETVSRRPTFPAYRAFLALIKRGQGKLAGARADFEMLAANRFDEIPHDNLFLACMSALSEIAAALGEAQRAAELSRLLRPYSELTAVIGPIGSMGAVARYLGLLASTCSRFSEAEQHFEKALAINQRTNAPVYVAYTQADYADMLLRRGSIRDQARARQLVSLAYETAQAYGMVALSRRLEPLRSQPDPARALSPYRHDLDTDALSANAAPSAAAGMLDPSLFVNSPPAALGHLATIQAAANEFGTAQDPQLAVFRREGDYWTILYGGQLVRMKHVKGLACLAYLLGHPTTDIHSSNLASVMERSSGLSAELAPDRAFDAGLGDAGPMLDSQAKAEYRRRRAELREELEEARQMNDQGRADTLLSELEFLNSEMARAVGLGGRDRHASSASERARLNVTKAIKSVLAKIAQNNGTLSRHLDATIRTGTFCSYRPDPASQVSWKLS